MNKTSVEYEIQRENIMKKWSALRLKKQYVYAQFDDAPKIRYKAASVVRDWLYHYEYPCHWTGNNWKKHRKTQYRSRS